MLPDSFREAVTHHHTPSNAEEYRLETAIVHLGNSIVNALGPDVTVDEHLLDDAPDFDPDTLKTVGIDTKALPALVEDAWQQTHEIMGIICPAV